MHNGRTSMAVGLRLFVDSIRRRGVRGSVQRLRRLVVSRREHRRRVNADRAFDAERHVDTASWVRVPDLDAESPNLQHAVRYQPSSVEEYHLLMGKLPVEGQGFAFVDYGAGKGRVLLLAAERPFERIVGVEFSPSLVETARRNLGTLGADGGRVELVTMDATEFDPPEEPLVLYFFNPFGPPVLRPVLERVRESLARRPRHAYIVLTGPPELAEVVEETGFEPVDVDRLGWRTRGVWTARSDAA